MTNLIIELANAKDLVTDIIEFGSDIVDLVEFASELWDENIEPLSHNCIKVTHKAYELLGCFILFVLNDGLISELSDEVLEEMGEVKVGESAVIIKIFVEGFVKAFLEEVEQIKVLVTEQIKVTLVKSLEELKLIAKALKVPSYASFKSEIRLQAAIDKAVYIQSKS